MSSPYVSNKEPSKSDQVDDSASNDRLDDCLEGDDNLNNILENNFEFMNWLNKSDGFKNESESIDEFGNRLEDDYEFEEVLDYENEFASKLESDENDSIITNTTSTLTSSKAYTDENSQDFYFSSTQYNLTQSELRKIQQHFSTISDVSGLQLVFFNKTGTKYGWLRTVDDSKFYAIVEYYLLYEFEGSKAMLAYIQWTSTIEEDSFVEINRLFYIVDKEVDDDNNLGVA
ncbi:9978_t:CDS:2 [Cetraspora pellucida]|uniref:9978_t:CDS:1 n=1 Tax=Cetraspora pellucida TaxID=1433469 RepID=A0ACA9JY85_9GLOM|nr:9978_t:CDS:2 [Cetraspora pellucida]